MTAERVTSSRLCPLVKRPRKECFCCNINSNNVESAILFCMGDFSQCEIYRKLAE